MRVSNALLAIAAAALLMNSFSSQANSQTIVDIPDGPNVALPGDPLNQDRAKFSVSTLPDSRGRAFYYSSQNNRILVNFQNPDTTWDFSTSAVAIEIPKTNDPEVTIAVGVVLRSASPIFRNALDNGLYTWLMYFIFQPSVNGGSAGFPCAAFSSDGLTWESPYVRVDEAPVATAIDCKSTDISTLKLEAIGGSLANGSLSLAGLEGSTALLASEAETGRTLTYLFAGSPGSPHALTNLGEFPPAGIVAPTSPGGTESFYFINLDFSYDPLSDRALLSRSIPFPYKFLAPPASGPGTSPCPFYDSTNVCPRGLVALPMRSQVYSKVVAGDPSNLLSGEWRLDLDIGQSTGWALEGAMSSCSLFPTFAPFQSTITVDTDSLNFFKDERGFIMREANGEGTLYLGGCTDRQMSCDLHNDRGSTFLDGLLYSLPIVLPIFSDGFESGDTARWVTVV